MATEERDREEELEQEVNEDREELRELRRVEHRVEDRLADHESELRRLRREQKYFLEVIVSGTPVAIETSPKRPLETVIVEALEKTNNHGQPPQNWTLRDEPGNELEPHRTPESYGFASGTKLFLSLREGVGGSRGAAQYVDPSVSHTKFDAEIAEYRYNGETYRRRGWLLVSAEFPVVTVAMTASHLRPMAMVTGVSLDYTNYDAEPPSVRLVNPFSGEPFLYKDLPTLLVQPRPDLGVVQQEGQPPQIYGQALMQAATPNDIPFLCIAGVREYHRHPAHTGDAWELHRSGGAGKLCRLLEVVYNLGVRPITWVVGMAPQFPVQQPPAQ